MARENFYFNKSLIRFKLFYNLIRLTIGDFKIVQFSDYVYNASE